MNALIELLDEGVRNVTEALKRTGMWGNTLLVFQADNGGWIQPNFGGNNWPLRGGKVSDFEGGVRTLGFLNGGWLPKGLRGTRHTGLAHVCDWYATFMDLAGVAMPQDLDSRGGAVPGLDSINLWPSLQIPNATATNRTEVPLAFCNEEAECDSPSGVGDNALIVGRYKIVTGLQGGLGYWQGPAYPNVSSAPQHPDKTGCTGGCLFDIYADPSETHNLRDAKPTTYARLHQRLISHYGPGVYQTNYSVATHCLTVAEGFRRDGGFLAPRCT